MTSLNELADRVEAATRCDNALDVLCEVALFKPGTCYRAIRANAAGTKVVYTDHTGNDVTCWAGGWTANRTRSLETAAALRSLASRGGGDGVSRA